MVLAGGLLAGCGGGDFSDLQAFMDEVDSRPAPAIQPLKTFTPALPFAYEAMGLRSPFEPPVVVKQGPRPKGPQVKPNPNRVKQYLEQYTIASLSMVGTLSQGPAMYALIQDSEGGVHRVQRVPKTESQGRIHTSACTVAVLPEVDEVEAEDINPAELRVDTYRASGAGGQHVNKTDSAVRITHLPTGVVVECQDERSQHKNKARAMSLLQARLLDQQVSAQETEQAAKRKLLVGSGDRSERIRTYNYPQGRVTDHRINLTLYKLDEILEGNLDQVIDPLINEYQADQLAALGD